MQDKNKKFILPRVKAGKHPNSVKALKPLAPGNTVRRDADNGKLHLRKFTKEYLEELLTACVVGNLDHLKKIVNDPNTPSIQVGLGRALFNAIKDGDLVDIEKILNRLVGRVEDRVDLTSLGKAIDSAPQVIVTVPSNGRENKD